MPRPMMHEQAIELIESRSGSVNDVTRSMAARALALASIDWDDVGANPRETTPAAASSPPGGMEKDSQNASAADMDEFHSIVEGIVALFMVRLAAVWDTAITTVGELPVDMDHVDSGSEGSDANLLPSYTYGDFSAETICRQTLREGTPWPFLRRRVVGNNNNNCSGGADSVVSQVRQYVATMLGRYDSNLPYHNYRHAYHVVLSVNKLLDLLLHQDDDGAGAAHQRPRLPPLFGLRRDANLQLALLFAALVHDAGHHGVTNQQLVRESNPIALLYNDTSVQEHNSLTLAFQTLLLDRYADMQACMFPVVGGAGSEGAPALSSRMDDGAFQRFRSTVISLVLSTDVANPDRSQLGKAVFKEAFRGRSGTAVDADEVGPRSSDDRRRSSSESRRGSMTSEISMPRIAAAPANPSTYRKRRPRRRSSHSSVCSLTSDVTSDSVARMMRMGSAQTTEEQLRSVSSPAQEPAKSARRGSMSSDYDSVAFLHRRDARTPRQSGRPSRRLSNDASVESEWTENGMDSIDLRRNTNATNRGAAYRRRLHNQHSFSSSTVDAASLLSSPSRSTGIVPDSERPTKHPATLGSPKSGITASQGQRGSANRHRIPRRWSTAMSGQSLPPDGLSPAAGWNGSDERIGARAQVSRMVHEYYGYGDCENEEDENSSLGEGDDNSSLSLTPPSSDDEMDGVVITGLTLSSSSRHGLPVGGAIVIARKKKTEVKAADGSRSGLGASACRNSALLASRRASTGMSVSLRHNAGCTLSDQIIDEGKRAIHGPHKDADDVLRGKDGWMYRHHQRRYSSDDGAATAAAHQPKAPAHGKRLGIRRSMDLSGESIERFSSSSNHSRLTRRQYLAGERRSSLGAMSTFSAEEGVVGNDCYHDYDEPDELKASVVAELVLRLADVGHYFQRYESMVRESSQSFRELLRAHSAGRGMDPRPAWFDNQVRIMECYLRPLADQLEGRGVLVPGTTSGDARAREEGRGGSNLSLVRNLDANHDQWMRQGFEVVASLIQESSSAHA